MPIYPLYVPESVARQNESDRQAKETTAKKAARDGALADLDAKLSANVRPLIGFSDRTEVYRLCQILMNRSNRIYTDQADGTLTWSEVARVVSDALLGPGTDYEIKT